MKQKADSIISIIIIITAVSKKTQQPQTTSFLKKSPVLACYSKYLF